MKDIATIVVRCPACDRRVDVAVLAEPPETDPFTGDLLVRLSTAYDHACPKRPPVPEEPR